MIVDVAAAPDRGTDADHAPAAPRSGRAGPVRLLWYAAGVLAGAAVLVALFPVAAGVPWGAVATSVAAVSPQALAALAVLWALGLLAHTTTLTAALPGLSRRRALLLSLTGSAVSNVLPLGGAAGIALNRRMTRRWGFSSSAFASYTVVSNLWDVLTKLFLPVLLVPLLLTGLPVPVGWDRLVAAAVVALPLVAGLAGALLWHPRLHGRLGTRVEQVRCSVADVVATGWGRLTGGMAVYTTLLLLLLAASLSATHADVGWRVVVLAFCAERLATLANLTPGGIGVVEVGLAGALVLSPGADPAGVAAGALLYRALTFGLEIPVGGLLLAGWCWRQRVPR